MIRTYLKIGEGIATLSCPLRRASRKAGGTLDSRMRGNDEKVSSDGFFDFEIGSKEPLIKPSLRGCLDPKGMVLMMKPEGVL